MLVRSWRRVLPLLFPLAVIAAVYFIFYDPEWTISSLSAKKVENVLGGLHHADEKPITVAPVWGEPKKPIEVPANFPSAPDKGGVGKPAQPKDQGQEAKELVAGEPSEYAGKILTEDLPPFHPEEAHHVIFSNSTFDQKYFHINFGERRGMNPNIIPHPNLENTWIIVAMEFPDPPVPKSIWCAELVCNAAFTDGRLACTKSPIILPIAATYGNKCANEIDYLGMNIGPHDARVFYGPTTPYAIYGEKSQHTCFGQFMIDFRLLFDWGFEMFKPEEFRRPTDLQRPAPWGQIEKNWFVFWDSSGAIYAHYDITPKRVFAKLEFDGSVGPDLAPLAAVNDDKCMARYFPKVGPKLESIHQATNSLSITLCKRSDSNCKPNDDNTFLFTIFQHKTYFQYHSVYTPYVMLFKRVAPFEIHAISEKPIWISGRGGPGKAKLPEKILEAEKKTWWQTEMFYVTSMSWKQKGQKHHGYIDDVLFLAFGIEDSDTGAIDVLAGSLLEGLGLCSQVS